MEEGTPWPVAAAPGSETGIFGRSLHMLPKEVVILPMPNNPIMATKECAQTITFLCLLCTLIDLVISLSASTKPPFKEPAEVA